MGHIAVTSTVTFDQSISSHPARHTTPPGMAERKVLRTLIDQATWRRFACGRLGVRSAELWPMLGAGKTDIWTAFRFLCPTPLVSWLAVLGGWAPGQLVVPCGPRPWWTPLASPPVGPPSRRLVGLWVAASLSAPCSRQAISQVSPPTPCLGRDCQGPRPSALAAHPSASRAPQGTPPLMWCSPFSWGFVLTGAARRPCVSRSGHSACGGS